MFKKGTFTIATNSENGPVWGHVFVDRDLEQGVQQLQCGVLYPGAKMERKLTARRPLSNEPTCASLESWEEVSPSLWTKGIKSPDHRSVYVVARARLLDLPSCARIPEVRATETLRPLFWIPQKEILEQWEPERWSIVVNEKLVGVLHVWQAVDPISDVGGAVPEHPPDNDRAERFALTYELWFTFAGCAGPPEAELHFATDVEERHLPGVNDILSGDALASFPGSKCVIVACSYYKALQGAADQGAIVA